MNFKNGLPPVLQAGSSDIFKNVYFVFVRSHKFFANSYETGSLRKFHLGRTEIIRASSYDSCEFVKSMNTKEAQNKSAKLFLKAASTHRANITNVVNGKSFDRHLFGLYLIALENNLEFPDYLRDVYFRRSSNYHLATSNTSSQTDSVFAMGPLDNEDMNCYGCVYNIKENKIIFGLTSFKSSSKASLREFKNQLEISLMDCKNLITIH